MTTLNADRTTWTANRTTLTADRTVGQIAAELPASVRVFEKHGIDFCCGGKIPVTEACRRLGIDATSLLAEIDEAVQGPAEDSTDWTTVALPALIDHILETHHVYTKASLPRVEAMLEKVLQAHGDRHGETLRAIAAVFAAMKAELDGHLVKEEMILFPLIRSLVDRQNADGKNADGTNAGGKNETFHCGSIWNPISVMLKEHESAGEGLVKIRLLTGGYVPPPDACNTFRALYFELAGLERDLHRHIHLENNILFPRAAALE